MANKRQMIIDRLWIMKKAAQEIDALTEGCNQNCNGVHCPIWEIGGGLHCCDIPKITKLYIPKV